jgi:hypothetical protein
MGSLYPMGFPTKEFGWKGKPFSQVIATIQYNKKNAPKVTPNQLRKALPLNLYRKEIHNISGQNYAKNCSTRVSIKIADFDRPGNNIVSEVQPLPYYSNGLVATLDINPTTLSAENGKCNNIAATCGLSPQNNARKRCRSAGMIPRKFDTRRNNGVYASSTQQYLTSRNRTIKQNEFNYIRKGTSGIIPGPGLAASNIYSPGGLSHCSQPYISAGNNNNIFQYVWVDGTTYTVTIPDGVYDIAGLNQVFQTAQIQNKTYFIDSNNNKITLLNISYDTRNNATVIYTGVTNKNSGYSIPNGATNWYNISGFPTSNPTPQAPNPNYTLGATYFIVPNTLFSNLIGFATGTYYSGIVETSYTGLIQPNYVTLYYKPNNPEYGVQGAVDASTRIHRLKYNTITTGANGIRSAYGNAAANALAYGVSEQAYTAKTIAGDKYTYTPVINPRTGQICKKQYIFRM